MVAQSTSAPCLSSLKSLDTTASRPGHWSRGRNGPVALNRHRRHQRLIPAPTRAAAAPRARDPGGHRPGTRRSGRSGRTAFGRRGLDAAPFVVATGMRSRPESSGPRIV